MGIKLSRIMEGVRQADMNLDDIMNPIYDVSEFNDLL